MRKKGMIFFAITFIAILVVGAFCIVKFAHKEDEEVRSNLTKTQYLTVLSSVESALQTYDEQVSLTPNVADSDLTVYEGEYGWGHSLLKFAKLVWNDADVVLDGSVIKFTVDESWADDKAYGLIDYYYVAKTNEVKIIYFMKAQKGDDIRYITQRWTINCNLKNGTLNYLITESLGSNPNGDAGYSIFANGVIKSFPSEQTSQDKKNAFTAEMRALRDNLRDTTVFGSELPDYTTYYNQIM